jgi:hypothetical protein
MSANLTHASLTKNQEEYFYTAHSGIRDSLHELYMIDSQKQKSRKSEYVPHPNLLICPIDCRAKITALFASAQQSIVIRGQYIRDSQIQNLLLAKKKA